VEREARIHFELYHQLKSTLDEGFSHKGITLERVEPEYNVNGGYADIALFDDRDEPWVVIEAKRKEETGRKRDIDPFSPKVIRQAFRYAGDIGSKYFATYNGRVLVLFHAFEKGVHLLERKSRAYSISNLQKFVPELLEEVIELDRGTLKWDPSHQTFIARLKEFHHRLAKQLTESLENELERESFQKTFKNWTERQGWGDKSSSDLHETFVTQASYLLMNKLLFYKILEDEPAYKDLPQIDPSKINNLSEQLRKLFDTIIEKHDFEVVYQNDPVFDELTLTDQAAWEIHDFLEELESYDLSQFDHDIIGDIYQKTIPAEERHDLGQYYTPPEIVNLICSLSITSENDDVLDPGCGSGGFLVGAYNRLKDLKDKPSHKKILEQIYGIDINRFPAHLSAINLALRNLSEETPQVNILVEDFFNIKPGEVGLLAERIGPRGSEKGGQQTKSVPTKVDAVIANPPYIRQEKIPAKEEYRRHLSNLAADLSKRSDVYSYFFTHGSEFLKEGGRLGFITSDRWLSVGYGEDLQSFFVNNFKILAVLEFNRQVFEDPLIGSCVTILEKCENSEERNQNEVPFILVKEKMGPQEIIREISSDRDVDTVFDTENYRIINRKQNNLKREEKWNRFINAPTIYWEIMSTNRLTNLGELARIKRGLTTGANQFFYFKNKDEVLDTGINERFISPLLKHISETEYIKLKREDLEWCVLDIHQFVKETQKEFSNKKTKAEEPEEVKQALQKNGYTALLDYIEQAEQKGLHNRASFKSRDVWFDLGELTKSSILLSEVYWREHRVLFNKVKTPVDKRLYYVKPKIRDEKALLGILNSSLTAVMREMHGREEHGEAMDRNTLMVYEARELPVINVKTLEQEDKRRISEAVNRIIDEERAADKDQMDKLQRELDKAVLSSIGMEDRADELQKVVKLLIKAREEGGGQRTGVLIEGTTQERSKKISLEGAQRIDKESNQNTLFDS